MYLTTNGCVSFHGKFNAEFNADRPNIFEVIDTLTEIKSETQIKGPNRVNTIAIHLNRKKKQELILEISLKNFHGMK